MSECSHDCSHCSANCDAREPGTLLEQLNPKSSVKKVIGVVSGKGGVGKSLVTSLLSVMLTRRGHRCGILDADITGPSIPQAFGLHDRAKGTEDGILPLVTRSGIQVMSVNLLLEDEKAPVIWRGPVISGAVKQFWTDVIWDDVEYLLIDMPPGTGDVPLTVFQSIPVDGIVIVTSPQELVSMIVSKAVKMANMMRIPIVGVIENYSYFECPDCHERASIFGESHIESIVQEFGIDLLARLPINPMFAQSCDAGLVEQIQTDSLDHACDVLEK